MIRSPRRRRTPAASLPERELTGADRLAKQVERLQRLDDSWAVQIQADHTGAHSHSFV
ncbi:hypothetical protein [Streptomyces sp. NPDC053079]|uniref:hypothetical protein n=1 Tax=Streptomyces sp. NPDC053079 TaxID=3365697 RepID=UPI0037CFE927